MPLASFHLSIGTTFSAYALAFVLASKSYTNFDLNVGKGVVLAFESWKW